VKNLPCHKYGTRVAEEVARCWHDVRQVLGTMCCSNTGAGHSGCNHVHSTSYTDCHVKPSGHAATAADEASSSWLALQNAQRRRQEARLVLHWFCQQLVVRQSYSGRWISTGKSGCEAWYAPAA